VAAHLETIYSSYPIRSPLAPYNDKTFATDGFIKDASSVGERFVKLGFLFTPFYLVPSGQIAIGMHNIRQLYPRVKYREAYLPFSKPRGAFITRYIRRYGSSECFVLH
jgi:hypothetical protein